MATEDRVLINIVTAANMAGVEQAKAGFLSMTPATLALAAVLAAVITVGKAAIDNYKLQTDANNELAQAVGVYNAQAGKTAAVTEVASAAIAKAQDAASKAHDSLTIATNAVTKAQLTYTEAVKAHGAKSDQAIKAALSLQDAHIHLTQAQEANTDAQLTLSAATASAVPVVHGMAIDLGELNGAFGDWLANNKRYVPDQYDAKTALASFVRAGSDATDAMRMLNDALDLATIKHEDLTSAANTLIMAEAGNSKGLRDLGITTAQYNDIMKGTAPTQQKNADLLALIETKTANGKLSTDALSQSQRQLNTDWQTFTSTIGPGVNTTLAGITDGADAALVAITLAATAFTAFANNNQGWANFQNWLLGSPTATAIEGARNTLPGNPNINSTGGSNAASNTNSGLNAIGGELATQTTLLQGIHAALTNPGRRGGTQSLDTLANALAARSRYAPGS